MNIGQAAKASGISAKMIRYYESVGLIPAPARTEAGYRTYGEDEVKALNFIRHARLLGFSLPELGKLLALWHDPARASAEVKAVAVAHIADLDRKIAHMAALRDALRQLTDCCAGDERPDCSILDKLAAQGQ